MKPLEDRLFVSGQIAVQDMSALAAAGITTIVNNRPDGEQPGQPASAVLAAAAADAGIAWRELPVSQLTGEAVEETVGLFEETDKRDGALLAFCASGTRSTFLWALARSRQGREAEALVAAAAGAGYDLSPIRRFLR